MKYYIGDYFIFINFRIVNRHFINYENVIGKSLFTDQQILKMFYPHKLEDYKYED